MKKSTQHPNEVTPAHHAALLLIACVGSLLLAYLFNSKKLGPDLRAATAQLQNTKREVEAARKFVVTTDSPEISELQRRIMEKESQVRTFQFQRDGDGGAPFVDTSDRQAVEDLMAKMLSDARGHQLVVRVNEPRRGQQVDSRFAKLVTRQLRLEGTFSQFYGFLAKIRSLPHRVLILELRMNEIKDMPGLLDITLVLSV